MSSDGATLVGVRSKVAASVALHGSHGSSIALSLPAGATIALAPGKLRLTLGKLGSTLRVGDRVPLILVVRQATGVTQEIDVDAEVRLHSPTDDHLRPHAHAAKPG
jgi:copper(I)-binding protein